MNPTNYGFIPVKTHQPVFSKAVNNAEIVEFRNDLAFWANRVNEITIHYNSSLQPAQIQQLVELEERINRTRDILSNRDMYRSKKIPPSLPEKLTIQKQSAPTKKAPEPKKTISEPNIKRQDLKKRDSKRSSTSSSTTQNSSIDDSPATREEPIRRSSSNKSFRVRQSTSEPNSVRVGSSRRRRSNRKNTAPSTIEKPPEPKEPEGKPLEKISSGNLPALQTQDQVQLGLALIKAVKYIEQKGVTKETEKKHRERSGTNPMSPRPQRRSRSKTIEDSEYPTALIQDFERMKKLHEEQQRTIERLQRITNNK